MATSSTSTTSSVRVNVVSAGEEDDVFNLDNDSNLDEMRDVMVNVEGTNGLRSKLDSADPEVKKFVQKFESEAFCLIETYHTEAVDAVSKRERMREMVEELKNQNEALKHEMNALREVIAFQADLDSVTDSGLSTPPLLANGTRSNSLQPRGSPGSPSSSGRFASRKNRGHRRVQSHHELSKIVADEQAKSRTVLEVEPEFYHQFRDWRETGYTQDHALMERIMHEDIEPCLRFDNTKLSASVLNEIRLGTLCLEPINEKDLDPKQRCSLVSGRSCTFRMRLMDAEEDYKVCAFARNRVMTVCEFFTYLKHLQMKLVRSEEVKILTELQLLRKHMALSRLGFPIEGR